MRSDHEDIDEARISNVERTAQWIKTEYNNQFSPGTFHSVGAEEPNPFTIIDRTGNYYDGEPVASMDSADLVTAQIGNGLDLDGTNDLVDLKDVLELGTSDWTVSAWAKASNSTDKYVISKISGTPGYSLEASNTAIDLKLHNGTTETSAANTSTGEFRHLVGAYDRDGNMTLYRDGSPSSADISGDAAVDISNTIPLVFGANCNAGCGTSANYFDGILDEIRISNVTRSADWVNAQYLSQSNHSSRGTPRHTPRRPRTSPEFRDRPRTRRARSPGRTSLTGAMITSTSIPSVRPWMLTRGR